MPSARCWCCVTRRTVPAQIRRWPPTPSRAVRSLHDQAPSAVRPGKLIGSEHPGPDDEMLIVPGRERESLRRSLSDIEDELGVLPHLILAPVDVIGGTPDPAQQYVA